MSTTGNSTHPRLRYHPNAYRFLFAALRRTQNDLGRSHSEGPDDDEAHISGQELVEGIRRFALDQFGWLAITVFREWGITTTGDFGRMVFELIERGEMRKTDQDQIEDFYGLFDFEEAFCDRYQFNVKHAFSAKEPRAKGFAQ